MRRPRLAWTVFRRAGLLVGGAFGLLQEQLIEPVLEQVRRFACEPWLQENSQSFADFVTNGAGLRIVDSRIVHCLTI
jgi:hypothetical protein